MTEHVKRQLIVIVDDTPDNILVLGDILRSEYEVKVAPTGEKALQIANADHKPDMILLDIMMPGMDGYEVCRRLKADPATSGIVVIFITVKDQVADEQLGFELGAVDYITKPVSPPLVLARVATHLELVEKRRNLEELLEKTLIGIISVLTDLLALSNPTAFLRASRLRRFMHEITRQRQIADAWQYETAAMLSQIGCASMSPETLERLFAGVEVTEEDRRQYREQFARSARILKEIPHLKNVAQMLAHLGQEYGAQASLPAAGITDTVALGAKLLNTLLYYDEHMKKGRVVGQALQGMPEAVQSVIDVEALETLDALEPQVVERQVRRSVTLGELELGTFVAKNVYTRDGLLILPEGVEVTEMVLEHLRNLHKRVGLVEPLIVI